ncbi:GTP-binding protein [Streptomyces carpinensis]|uniref:GTP-binding protein n=1 Tax=Streptomyces carpinensis TaxID=66369 RepID=UPI001FC9FDD8|nr:GTP-binding protein [Streptomyces carpinensis]
MNNGCICCPAGGDDLISILGTLMRRREKCDRIFVETTDLADPRAGRTNILRR